MKKYCFKTVIFLLVVCFVIPFSTNAVESRALSIAPGLSFSGTTAYCEVTIACDHSYDEIYATMKLWEGNYCIATWTASGEGVLVMEKTKSNCTSGQEYTVTVDAVINNVSKPRVHIKRTC